LCNLEAKDTTVNAFRKIILASWACALFGLSCSTASFAQGVTKVKLAYFPALVSTTIFVAKEEGIFHKNSLEVELVPFTNGPALLSALLSGSTEFIDGGAAVLSFPQVARGHKIRGLVSFWSQAQFTLIARSDIPTPNKGKPYPAPLLDLKGKRVGVTSLGSGTAAMVEFMARDAGLKPGEDITLVAAGGVNTATAGLLGGSIDAYLSYPPIDQMLDARAPGAYTVILPQKQLPPLIRITLNNHLATTQEYISSKPTTVHAMCRSIREALQWLRVPSNFDRAVAILEKSLPGSPPGVMAAALKDSLPQMAQNSESPGDITPTAVDNANKVLTGLKYIPQAVPYSTYVYPQCGK
jgi:NitT/TauT family transport system substrate-binding protein